MHHQHIIAVAFRVCGWALGIPALLLFLDLSVNLIALHFRPAPDKLHLLDIGSYGLVGLLVNGAQVFGKLFEGISVVATWIMDAAAIISLIVVGFAAILYFTGQGIENHATWARVVAMLISVSIVLISLGAMTAVPRHLLAVPILTMGASFYTLWVLGWKFS
jgi:hypothetical protein